MEAHVTGRPSCRRPDCRPPALALAAAVWIAALAVPPGTAGQSVMADRTEGQKMAAIHIQSDRMEALDQEGKVIFTGHVVASRQGLIINADTLEVHYTEEKREAAGGEDPGRVVRTITATGHVRITQEGKVASGDKAVYDRGLEKITLTGSAQVWDGPNRVSGNRIVLFLNEDRSVVEGSGTDKVEAVVYPADH